MESFYDAINNNDSIQIQKYRNNNYDILNIKDHDINTPLLFSLEIFKYDILKLF